LHFHAQYWLLGPLLLGRFGRAVGSSGSDNEPISPALSSEEKSNTSGMILIYPRKLGNMEKECPYCLKIEITRMNVGIAIQTFERK
jgi:hypothetical protein